MKFRQVMERIGEKVGEIDWTYEFRQHDWNESHGGMNPSATEGKIEMLRQLCDGGEYEATTDGGWPRCGWGVVRDVGMYDGWPHWKPTPSVYISGTLGGSWHPFYSLTEIRRLKGDK